MPAPQLRLQVLIQLILSRDSGQLQNIFDNRNAPNVIDDFTGTAVDYFMATPTLNPSAASVAVPFGNLTRVSSLYIIADDDITVQLDSNTAPAIPVRGIAADTSPSPVSSYAVSRQPGLVFWRGRIQSLFIGNPSNSSTAQCTIIGVGEAAA